MSVPQLGPVKAWSFYGYANRNTKGWNDGVQSGIVRLPHAYMAFYLPFSKCMEMSTYLQATDLANLGAARMMIMPLIKKYFRSSSFALPEEEMIGHFRIYRIVRNGENGPDHLKMLEHNEKVLVPKRLEMCAAHIQVQ